MNENFSAIILAAGEGSRMMSSKSKLLHEVQGKPVIQHVMEACHKAKVDHIIMVVGKNYRLIKALIKKEFDGKLKVHYVLQQERLGTGHAISVALKSNEPLRENVLIMSGDVPFLTAKTIDGLKKTFTKKKVDGIIGVSKVKKPFGYGRIIKDKSGFVIKIVEEKDAGREEKVIKEVNGGIYIFRRKDLEDFIPRIPLNKKKKEYYLTDIVKKMSKNGRKLLPRRISFNEVLGINTRVELTSAGKMKNSKVLEHLAKEGVTIVDFNTTFIEGEVTIGKDTIIYPFTIIKGKTIIGKSCKIGPSTNLKDAVLGERVEVVNSHIRDSRVLSGSTIGPFSNIRPGTVVGEKCKIGNYVELKNSMIGSFTKISHLSYIGDAEIGENSNIGAATITCNFDGVKKYRTTIGKNVFVGSGTKFVAPVKIGDNAVISDGSTITEDVPPFSLATSRGKQETKKNWVLKRRKKK
ncbi:MAG: bifunctional UDP-N-acetylglucosamine diphosphorylase/glucosamine-1-phosphate N-acetyltransferase GlmU [bacterium]